MEPTDSGSGCPPAIPQSTSGSVEGVGTEVLNVEKQGKYKTIGTTQISLAQPQREEDRSKACWDRAQHIP